MKKHFNILMLVLVLAFITVPAGQVLATPIAIVEVIKAAVKKVIKAIDLKIQRLQNKTIWLQNAQKVLENNLSKLKLTEIADWTEKQKEQYQKYFDELAKVKMAISQYQRIKDIAKKQANIVSSYNSAWKRIRDDKNFTAKEIDYMERVYEGILDQTIKNVDEILLVVRSFSLKMSDAQRIEMLNRAAENVDQNFNDLIGFSRQNMMLSMQRAKTQEDIQKVRKLYGIE